MKTLVQSKTPEVSRVHLYGGLCDGETVEIDLIDGLEPLHVLLDDCLYIRSGIRKAGVSEEGRSEDLAVYCHGSTVRVLKLYMKKKGRKA